VKQSPKDIERSVRTISRRAIVLGGVQLAFMARWGSGCASSRSRRPSSTSSWPRRTASTCGSSRRARPDLRPQRRGDRRQRPELPHRHRARGRRRRGRGVAAAPADRPRRDRTRARLREMYRRSPFVPVTIADRLSWEDFSRVAVNAPALPGIATEVGLSRHYPMGQDFAHAVGYVGPVSEYDLSRRWRTPTRCSRSRFQIGKLGVEARSRTRCAARPAPADRDQRRRPRHARAWPRRGCRRAPTSS
jgi:penicillin-binding protein 2